MSAQIQVSVRGGEGFQRSGLIREFIDAVHKQGFAVDLTEGGMAVGGTFRRFTKPEQRVVIDNEMAAESEPHRRWREQSLARHVAVLALVTLGIMAAVMSVLGAS